MTFLEIYVKRTGLFDVEKKGSPSALFMTFLSATLAYAERDCGVWCVPVPVRLDSAPCRVQSDVCVQLIRDKGACLNSCHWLFSLQPRGGHGVNGNPDGRQRTHSNQPRASALLLDRQIGGEFITECNSILAFSLLHLTQVHGLVLSHRTF